MVNSVTRRRRRQNGQASVLVIASVSIFLLGAVGLAIDGSQLYAQRQMTQSAADAAALAGILGIFNGSTSIATAHDCTTAETISPCWYAHKNGFGTTTGAGADTVHVDPNPGIAISGQVSPTELQVTITRPVSMTMTKMVGLSSFNVKASATAAVLNVTAPVPLLITDPINSNTLSMNGTTSIEICGGPTRSIQINTSNSTGYGGGGSVNLSHAGPADPGNCTTGTGADFGIYGGPHANPGVSIGTTGHYLQPASPIKDPLAGVAAPGVPGAPVTGVNGATIHSPTDGCTSTCTEFSPGLYTGGISLQNQTVIFKPGLYYMQGGGFTLKKVSGGGSAVFNGLTNGMCTGCTPDANTGNGMVVYDTGPSGSTVRHNPAGGFTMDTLTSIFLTGSTLTTTNAQGNTVPAAPYYGILFFEDRTADKNLNHNLGQGNASFAWEGTIYITNTLAIMQDTTDPAYPNHVQGVTYNGGPSGSTIQKGYFVVGRLSMVGNTAFKMQLTPFSFLTTSQVALVQ